MTPRSAAFVAVPVAVLAFAGCSSGGSSPAPGPVVETVTVGASGPVEPVTLHLSTRTERLCPRATPPVDYAWWEVQVEFEDEVEWLDVRLVDPAGVEVAGSPVAVPPRNPGGAILIGGTSRWGEHRDLLRDEPQVRWSAREPVQFMSGSAGQTALLVLRLRFTDEQAGFDGVEALWTTPDGRRGSTSVPATMRYDFTGECAG